MLRIEVKKYASHAKHIPREFVYGLGMAKKRDLPAGTLATNLKRLMTLANNMSARKLSGLSGVSDRYIGMILNRDHQPTVEIAEALAKPFGLTGWQLIMPNLDIDLAKSGKLTELIHKYQTSSKQTRALFDFLVAQEAANDEGPQDDPPPTKIPHRSNSSTVMDAGEKKGVRRGKK